MKHYTDGQLPLLPIVSGQGAWLITESGHRLLDGISSWWVNLFGHCHPRINAAIRDQLATLEHVLLAGFTHQPVIELSERLSKLTDNELGHCFYASDGASATEIALKMSVHYWHNHGHEEKQTFVCLAGGYHGETAGALGVTDIALFRDAYAPLLRPAAVVPSPDSRQTDDPIEAAHHAARSLEEYFDRHHRTIAALILEPLVQCASGMVMYHPEYLRQARRLCDHYRIHLICDEIAVGCGRTGSFFAHEQAGIRPDFLCLSKGISGGYLPLSLVMTRSTIHQAFYDDTTKRGFLHSHSYTGNPLACRAALATLDLFTETDAINENRHRSTLIAHYLAPLTDHPRVRHCRQHGMIYAFDIDADPDFSRRYYRAALDSGVLLRPIGNTVYLMPPYILDHDEIRHLCQSAIDALEIALNEPC